MNRPNPNFFDAQAREAFSQYLISRREALSLGLEQISRETRIPESSLLRLESGAFEQLPGDVFVRGFVRAYARCVGLDPEEAVKRYVACGMPPAPVAAPSVHAQVRDDRILCDEPVRQEQQTEPEMPVVSTPRFLTFPHASDGDENGSKRVTVAVVILAIIATLTMSYLLRRPSGYGEGITQLSKPASTLGYKARSGFGESTREIA
jgi:hypothetical protein